MAFCPCRRCGFRPSADGWTDLWRSACGSSSFRLVGQAMMPSVCFWDGRHRAVRRGAQVAQHGGSATLWPETISAKRQVLVARGG